MTAHVSLAPTTLLLCRHGQSEWNAQGRVQGQAPEAGGLTEQGRWEAQQLGQRLQALDVAALYASDLLRARETAQIVGAALNLPVQYDARWREIDLGIWRVSPPMRSTSVGRVTRFVRSICRAAKSAKPLRL